MFRTRLINALNLKVWDSMDYTIEEVVSEKSLDLIDLKLYLFVQDQTIWRLYEPVLSTLKRKINEQK